MKQCSIEDCTNEAKSRGWCVKHYTRWQVHGDPLKAKFKGATLEETLNHFLQVQGDCLIWTGTLNRGGYGVTKRDGKTLTIHRLVFAMAQGPIPEGMHVDHICHNRACGKLEHLRLVTRKQNAENRAGADRNTQTGIRGVTVQRRTGKFIAQVTHDNKWYYAGLHLTAEAAGEAARLKRLELFTHNEADRKAA